MYIVDETRTLYGTDLTSSHVSTDYEISMNAIREVFPHCKLAGCLFHLCQILWREVQSEGLAPIYMKEECVELWDEFHAAIALAFVPYDIDNDGQDIEEANSSHDLEPIFQHREENYVLGRHRGHGRWTPLFPTEMWNCY